MIPIIPAEGYGAHIRSVVALAQEVEDVRNIAETAAGGGISEAPINTTGYVRKGGLWVPETIFSMENARVTRLLEAQSVALTQYPAGLGDANARQVEFGPAQKTPSDPVQLDGLGTVTFNQVGLYRIKVAFQFGRETNPNTSIVLFRVLANGVQAGRSIAVSLADDHTISYIDDDSWLVLVPGVQLKYEVMRDASGHDSGGLKGFATTGTWNDCPSSFIRIEKFIDA